MAKITNRGMFAFVLPPILIAPWLFGAWEMWWFWPCAACIFVATALLGLQLCSRECTPAPPTRRWAQPWWVAISFLPFLIYAGIRLLQATVTMDAERSFLLHLTPLLLALIVGVGLEPRQRTRLFWMLAINLLLLGLYGIVNHMVTQSSRVMWAPGIPTYYEAGRASGSYFCPDHYAGVLEIGICLAVGLLLRGRWTGPRLAVIAGLVVIGISGILLSKSRGAGMALVVIAGAALTWGLGHVPRAARWWWRLAACALLLLMLVGVSRLATGYTERFLNYFTATSTVEQPLRERVTLAASDIRKRGRAHAFSAAWRAWQTQPWTGIGPGMHVTLWPHFAASPDGDRQLHRWPSFPNYHFVANTVHNDWLQLLEEYGLVGFLLFLIPVVTVVWTLRQGLDPSSGATTAGTGERVPERALAALLVIAALAFHSMGDFNLQMPATTWMVAVVISLALCPDAERKA
ncbi:MAG: O-antigen ligase family protein [Verrucomicrobia bacterium]|nr:O-antigen ligase family protein [Verrucomicrobiota bacterium]